MAYPASRKPKRQNHRLPRARKTQVSRLIAALAVLRRACKHKGLTTRPRTQIRAEQASL
jgi:hypothetical protein